MARATGQRSNSLPDLGAPKNGSTQEQPVKRGAPAPNHPLKRWLPHLEKRSLVYGVCSETVRRHEVIEALERFRSEGDLPRLWAAVRRAKLDVALSDIPSVTNMSQLLAQATKQKVICENIAQRVAKTTFTTKDVRVLEKAVKELEQLQLGPKLWKDTMYPMLGQVEALLPHIERLRHLVQEHRAGCKRYCSAWLAVMKADELASSYDLQVSTARWLLSFPDATAELGGMVSEDVICEFWRLVESTEGGGSDPVEASRPASLAQVDARLAEVLVLAGQPPHQAIADATVTKLREAENARQEAAEEAVKAREAADAASAKKRRQAQQRRLQKGRTAKGAVAVDKKASKSSAGQGKVSDEADLRFRLAAALDASLKSGELVAATVQVQDQLATADLLAASASAESLSSVAVPAAPNFPAGQDEAPGALPEGGAGNAADDGPQEAVKEEVQEAEVTAEEDSAIDASKGKEYEYEEDFEEVSAQIEYDDDEFEKE